MRQDHIEQAVRAISNYDFGRSAVALFELDSLINAAHGDRAARDLIERELAGILETDASLAAKQEVCRRLWRIGTDNSLGPLRAMLGDEDPRIVAAACYAIGRRPSRQADEALRAALRDARGACRDPIEHLIEDRG